MQQEMQEKSEALIPDRKETWEVRKNKTMGAEDVTRPLCQLGLPVECDKTLMSAGAYLWSGHRERGCWRARPEVGHCAPCSSRCSQAHGAPGMFLEGSKFNSFIFARNFPR